MQFKQGTNVYTDDEKHVGSVDKVVLDPTTKEVTHIVVRKGFLFVEDKLIPVSLIASADEDRVNLRPVPGGFDSLLPFEETHYLPVDEAEAQGQVDLASPLYWYPPVGGWMGYGADYAYAYPPPYVPITETNAPKNSLIIDEGAMVISADGKHVGNVERVLTEPQADRATYFVMSQGLLFRERKSVPITWIREVKADAVHLSVGAHTLEGLREYQEA
jgi:uncharacterized protein YrrD